MALLNENFLLATILTAVLTVVLTMSNSKKVLNGSIITSFFSHVAFIFHELSIFIPTIKARLTFI